MFDITLLALHWIIISSGNNFINNYVWKQKSRANNTKQIFNQLCCILYSLHALAGPQNMRSREFDPWFKPIWKYTRYMFNMHRIKGNVVSLCLAVQKVEGVLGGGTRSNKEDHSKQIWSKDLLGLHPGEREHRESSARLHKPQNWSLFCICIYFLKQIQIGTNIDFDAFFTCIIYSSQCVIHQWLARILLSFWAF